MTQSKKVLVFILSLAVLAGGIAPAQTTSGANQQRIDKAAAYYNFAMGHLYADLAGSYGNRGEYLGKAIEHYKLAMKADPGAGFISEELSDLYIQSGRISEAVTEWEGVVKKNPEEVNARRILGRIYTRMIGDPHQNRINDKMLKSAIEQFEKVTEREPGDTDVWLTLGRLYKISQNSAASERAYKKVLESNPDHEDALTGLAMVYSDVGDTKQATEMLQRVAGRNPSMRSLMMLAGAYEQMQEYGMAGETIRKALELDSSNIELKRALAQNLMLADRYDESLKVYQELAAEDEKDPQNHLRMSQIYRQMRQYAKARESSDKAKELDPNSLEIRYNEVSLLEAEGKMDEAIGTLKGILEATARRSYMPPERTNRVALLERLGLLYRGNEQFKESLEVFQQMADLDPDMGGRATAQKMETLRMAKDFTQAEAESEAAVKKYPEDRLVRVIRANILAELGKSDQAAADLKKLLDGRNDRDTLITLAQVYDKGKKYDEMAKVLDEAEKLSKDEDEKESVIFLRGAMYEKMKKWDLAEQEFRKVLAMNPENASALNYLGYMLADRNVRLQEAHDLIEKALELDPHNGAFLDSMGWVLFRMNKLDEAENLLLRSLERVKRDPTVHDHLGDVYFRQGRVKEAISQWEIALKEWNASAPSEMDHTAVAEIQKKLGGAKVRLAKESSAGATQQQ